MVTSYIIMEYYNNLSIELKTILIKKYVKITELRPSFNY